jgi:nucleotide-binding universal stress UspA family protein
MTKSGGFEVFRRILVAVDGSRAGRTADIFATKLADQFGAATFVVQFTEASGRRSGGQESVIDQPEQGNLQRSELRVCAYTRAALDHQLVCGVAKVADDLGADLIVLGLDRRRLSHRHFSRSVREQLTRATELPVMIPATSPSRDNEVRGSAEDPIDQVRDTKEIECERWAQVV